MRYRTSRWAWAEYLAVKIVNLGVLRKARRRPVDSPLDVRENDETQKRMADKGASTGLS